MKHSFLVILTLFSFSCNNKRKSSDEEIQLVIDTASYVDTISKINVSAAIPDTFILHPIGYKDISQFYDTTINGIKLNDCDTIVKLFGDHYKLLPDIDDLPSIQILNNKESQLLTMYMWNGSSKCDFSQFKVEYTTTNPKYLQKPFKLHLDNFKSGKTVYLGITSNQLKSRLGKPNEVRNEKGLTIFSYQQYNDLYFADYYFKDDKLIKFRYGNEYP
jgi:hypothetical protein